MSVEIKVPVLPESVTDATVSKWYKNVGDRIERDENLVDLETDKVMLEVPAPAAGVIEKILVESGGVVNAGQVLAIINESGVAKEGAIPDLYGVSASAAAAAEAIAAQAAAAPAPAPAAAPQQQAPAPAAKPAPAVQQQAAPQPQQNQAPAGPAARREAAQQGVETSQISGSGKEGRVTKQDVQQQANKPAQQPVAGGKHPAPPSLVVAPAGHQQQAQAPAAASSAQGDRGERRVPMSRLRARIAERLLESQHNAAILTTFNEINMAPVMEMRNRYKDAFEKQYGVRLGFMSFFTKAVIEALKRFPEVNAYIDGNDIVYHNYYDIGVAIGGPRGLVVPIMRNAENLNMAEIEKTIRGFADRANSGKLSIEEMTGGTFTISNGGTYGSLLSTPIINPPQSGILGMHKIMDRAVVEDGEIVIRPMMYVAFSYDHRIIDGSQSVRFLVTIKEMLEDPARLVLGV